MSVGVHARPQNNENAIGGVKPCRISYLLNRSMKNCVDQLKSNAQSAVFAKRCLLCNGNCGSQVIASWCQIEIVGWFCLKKSIMFTFFEARRVKLLLSLQKCIHCIPRVPNWLQRWIMYGRPLSVPSSFWKRIVTSNLCDLNLTHFAFGLIKMSFRYRKKGFSERQ